MQMKFCDFIKILQTSFAPRSQEAFITEIFTALCGGEMPPGLDNNESTRKKLFECKKYVGLTKPVKRFISEHQNKEMFLSFCEEHVSSEKFVDLCREFNIKLNTEKEAVFSLVFECFLDFAKNPKDDIDFTNMVKSKNINTPDQKPISNEQQDYAFTRKDSFNKLSPDYQKEYKRMFKESRRIRFFTDHDVAIVRDGRGLHFKTQIHELVQSKRSRNSFDSLYDIYKDMDDDNRFVFLVSKGGAGKTYAMLRLYRDIIFEAGVNAVYINARKLNPPEPSEHCGAIKKRLCEIEQHRREADGSHCDWKSKILIKDKECDSKELVIILDSINESRKYKDLSVEIETLINDFPSVRFFVSARPGKTAQYIRNTVKAKKREFEMAAVEESEIRKVLCDNNLSIDNLSKEFFKTLSLPLMLQVYVYTKDINRDRVTESKGKNLKIKAFYEDPVESLVIWNYYHTLVQKHLDDPDEAEPLRFLLALEYILPDIAYSFDRDGEQFLSISDEKDSDIQSKIKKRLEGAIKRLDTQLGAHLHRFERLPRRIADLNGYELLLGNTKPTRAEFERFKDGNIFTEGSNPKNDKHVKRIKKIVLELLCEESRADSEKEQSLPESGDTKLSSLHGGGGFFHKCMCSCLAALHIINSSRLAEFHIPGTEIYVSKLWIKHSFAGMEDGKEPMDDMLRHFAELDKRGNGAERLRRMNEIALDVGAFGRMKSTGERVFVRLRDNKNGYSVPEVDVTSTDGGNKLYNNYFLSNVNAATEALLKGFETHDDYLHFKSND